jgi:hypothetical protein
VIAALLVGAAIVGVRCAVPFSGSGDDDAENGFCFYAVDTRTLDLVAEPVDDALSVLPLALDGLVDTAPAAVRADAEVLLEAARRAAEEGSPEPLRSPPVQEARQRVAAAAAERCQGR